MTEKHNILKKAMRIRTCIKSHTEKKINKKNKSHTEGENLVNKILTM